MKYYEVNFNIKASADLMQSVSDVVSALAGEASFETFEETADGLTGYVQQQLFDEVLLRELLATLPFTEATVDYTVGEAENLDWNEQWEQTGFDPIVIGGRIIIHDGVHLPELNSQHPTLNIQISARMAFGTGTHETTRMMVGTLADMPLEGCRVLDCGTGTGILSIAALKLGAREAVGYDIDEWSVDNARHNAAINSVDDRFSALLGDAGILNKVEGVFDVVVANINRNILLADMPAFVAKLARWGTLMLSGFYCADVPLLKEKAETLGMVLTNEKEEHDWCCIRFTAR